jgi:putative mRNA 3-end processing factor
MAREARRIIMDYKEFLKDPRLFMDAMHSVDWVEGLQNRQKALKTPGVIISTAGMLKGGPAVFYMPKLCRKAINAVYLVSYQIPRTPGHELMEKGTYTRDGKIHKIKAAYHHFDFSSHCGASKLKEALIKVGGTPKVFVVHGTDDNCKVYISKLGTQ